MWVTWWVFSREWRQHHPKSFVLLALVKRPVSVWVSVHHSTIRKMLGKNDLHGRVPRCKNKINAEQKEHKGLSQICQKTSWWSSWLLGKYSVDWQDKSGHFWKACVSHYIWRKSYTASWPESDSDALAWPSNRGFLLENPLMWLSYSNTVL